MLVQVIQKSVHLHTLKEKKIFYKSLSVGSRVMWSMQVELCSKFLQIVCPYIHTHTYCTLLHALIDWEKLSTSEILK